MMKNPVVLCALLVLSLPASHASIPSRHNHTPDHAPAAPTHNMQSPAVWKLTIEQLELQHAQQNLTGHYALEFWAGSDTNRIQLNAESDVDTPKQGEYQALWWQPMSAFWNRQIGIHYTEQQTSLALGLEGTAPYWIEVSAQLRLSNDHQTALEFELAHDLQLSRQLLLSSEISSLWYGKDHAALHQVRGLSEVETSLRLGYIINPQWNLYLGIQHTLSTEQDADPLSQHDTKGLLGLRAWF